MLDEEGKARKDPKHLLAAAGGLFRSHRPWVPADILTPWGSVQPGQSWERRFVGANQLTVLGSVQELCVVFS